MPTRSSPDISRSSSYGAPPKTASARDTATIYFFPSLLYIPYPIFGDTARATFPGSVHGVVVHAKMYVSFSPIIGKAAVTEISVMSLYPCATSKFESVVSHLGQMCIGLYPSYTSPCSESFFHAHQIDSVYEVSIVLYGRSISTNRPVRGICSFHSLSY